MRWDFFLSIEKRIDAGFRCLGYSIATYPWTCIIIPILLSLILSCGVVRYEEVNNVRDDFNSDNSPSRFEFAVAQEFFQELGRPFHVVVSVVSADGGNILRPGHIDRALQIENHLQYHLKIEYEGRQYAYSDFCGAQCETSDAVNVFLTVFRDVSYNGKSSVKLTFPSIDVYGHKIYLANNIFDVEINEKSKLIESTKLIAINFHAVFQNSTMEEVMKKWERAVYEYSLQTHTDNFIHLHTISEGLVSEEVRKTCAGSLPLILISFVIIVAFTVLTSLKNDPVKSKPWEAFIGVICPLISIGASFGSLFWLGFPFRPIVVSVPFLVLAIGVDDVFIFLHAWSHSNEDAAVRDRVATTLANAGTSITITSLTNYLSFAIGIWSSTPAIKTFCIYMSTAVLVAYIYQIVFYTAVIAISGRREKAQLNAYVPCIKVADYKLKRQHLDEKSEWKSYFSQLNSNLLDYWVDFCVSNWTRLGLAVVLISYWTLSAYGVYEMKVGITSEKLFTDDSPLLKVIHLHRHFKGKGQMLIFVNNPNDLRKPEAIADLMKVVGKFENSPGSAGFTSTEMWLNAYLAYVGTQTQGSVEFTYKYLPEFLITTNSIGGAIMSTWAIHSFQDATAWTARLTLLQNWRGIASASPELNLTIYENFSMYADQLLTIPPAAIQTVLLALLCMSVVLVVFTPNCSTIIPGIVVILSINLGVFGLLYYWNIDLDPITITTTLMAIGLSVDFVAHINFHYYRGDLQLIANSPLMSRWKWMIGLKRRQRKRINSRDGIARTWSRLQRNSALSFRMLQRKQIFTVGLAATIARIKEDYEEEIRQLRQKLKKANKEVEDLHRSPRKSAQELSRRQSLERGKIAEFKAL